MSRSVGVQTGIGVGSQLVREVIQSAAADIGNVDPKAQHMFSTHVRREIGAIKVVFSSTRVGLRSTRCEGSGAHDLGRLGHTAYRGVVMAKQKSQLVHPARRK